jgi:Domain of unknown function (DUF1816)
MAQFMIKQLIATIMQYQKDLVKRVQLLRSVAPLNPAPPAQPPWWVEVNTAIPLCTYYFGPFDHRWEARGARAGYVEDLQTEGARDIVALVKQCQQPTLLTVDHGYYSATGQHD